MLAGCRAKLRVEKVVEEASRDMFGQPLLLLMMMGHGDSWMK